MNTVQCMGYMLWRKCVAIIISGLDKRFFDIDVALTSYENCVFS